MGKKKDNAINLDRVNPTQSNEIHETNQDIIPVDNNTPAQYSDNIKEEVINRVINGENPYTISQDKGMPSFRAIYDWCFKSGALLDFARSNAFKTLAVASSPDLSPQDKAIEVKSIQWLSSKLAAHEFGDSTTLKLADNEGNKLTISNIIDQID